MALTTGFCGCLTTYSGWNNQQAMGLVIDGFFDDISRGMTLITWPVGLFCFIGTLLFGRDIGRCLKNRHRVFNNCDYKIIFRLSHSPSVGDFYVAFLIYKNSHNLSYVFFLILDIKIVKRR